MFREFLAEAGPGELEIAATNLFPADAVYSTQYKGQDYVVVNFDTVNDMERYLPFAWAVIRTKVQPDAFSFVAYVGAHSIGTALYVTQGMSSPAAALSKPDGSEPNPAAVEIIAALKKETRIKKLQSEFEQQEPKKTLA